MTEEEVLEFQEFFPLRKFFIYGHARSGTTLLMNLVRLHPDIHCDRQAHFFSRPPLLSSLVSDPEVVAWLSRKSNRWNRGKDLSPVVMRAASDFILERDARMVGKHIVGDKSPNNLLCGEAIHLTQAIYPDGQVIFIVRDGRDAVISHRFQTFIDGVQHLSKADLKIRQSVMQDPHPYISGEKSLFSEESIIKAAQGWVKNVTETQEAGEQLFHGKYLSLRFEDLLKNPFIEMKRVWSFLEADTSSPVLEEIIETEMKINRDARWQQTKTGDFAQTLPKGHPGYWREIFTNRDRQIFKEIAGETLITWNYELNMDW